MLINFNKELRGVYQLSGFIPTKMTRGEMSNEAIAHYYDKIDLRGIGRKLSSDLGSELSRLNYEIHETRDGGLWVSKPVPFSLSVGAFALDRFGKETEKEQRDSCFNISYSDFEKTREKLMQEFWIFSRVKSPAVLEEIPRVIVRGKVAYEIKEDCQDPTVLIGVLRNQKYDVEIVTTPQQMALAKYKATLKAKRINGNQIRHAISREFRDKEIRDNGSYGVGDFDY